MSSISIFSVILSTFPKRERERERTRGTDACDAATYRNKRKQRTHFDPFSNLIKSDPFSWSQNRSLSPLLFHRCQSHESALHGMIDRRGLFLLSYARLSPPQQAGVAFGPVICTWHPRGYSECHTHTAWLVWWVWVIHIRILAQAINFGPELLGD